MIFSPWWWRQYVPPKRRFSNVPHGVTSQKTAFFIVDLVLVYSFLVAGYQKRIQSGPLEHYGSRLASTEECSDKLGIVHVTIIVSLCLNISIYRKQMLIYRKNSRLIVDTSKQVSNRNSFVFPDICFWHMNNKSIFRITVCLDFIYRPGFYITRKHNVPKLDLFPSSDEGMEDLLYGVP
jgi:hypothetical protein